jgi:hypothetical protein
MLREQPDDDADSDLELEVPVLTRQRAMVVPRSAQLGGCTPDATVAPRQSLHLTPEQTWRRWLTAHRDASTIAWDAHAGRYIPASPREAAVLTDLHYWCELLELPVRCRCLDLVAPQPARPFPVVLLGR